VWQTSTAFFLYVKAIERPRCSLNADNEEITNIKKLGLENKRYTSIDELRYGKVMVLADQDVDGSHIKGLLINVFSALWPSLFSIDGFLSTMSTPIVKVKGRDERSFYNLTEYEEWRAEFGQENGWRQVLQGLGTSTTAEAKEYQIYEIYRLCIR
jgi:DNA topoisomerase-2